MKIRHFLLLGAVLASLGCKEKAQPEAGAAASEAEREESSASASKPVLMPVFAAPDTFRAALGKVYEGYTQIQTALAEDDLAKAKEAFSPMHAVLHMMPKDGLDPAAKAYWDSTDARLMEVLHPMASANTLEAARRQFISFSQIMAEAIGKFGIAGDAPVLQFHCPMAKDGKGADWLQKEGEPANPYFGKSMLRCGSLVRKLNG